jgi:cell division transport system ATP-binding protein
MGTTVVVATHNEGLVGRFTHRQLRIVGSTLTLTDPTAPDPMAADPAAGEAAPQEDPAQDSTQPQAGMGYGQA